MPAGGPRVDLSQPTQPAILGPAKPVADGAAVRGSQVTGEGFPGPARSGDLGQGLQQEQPASDRQHGRGGQVPWAAQRGQAIRLHPEQAQRRSGQGLADQGRAIGVADQPDIGHGSAGQAVQASDARRAA
jgi:hypothetical protein